MRKRPTKRQKTLTEQRQRDRCALCEKELADGDIAEWDHIIPLFISQSNDDGNWQKLCKPCHLAKTRTDVRAIHKTKRQAAKHNAVTRQNHHHDHA